MPKPQHIGGYTAQHTTDCERVLVTLLRGLGPWGKSVFLFDEKQVRVELLDERGVAEVTVKHANIVSFTCLKAFAYEDRHEPKDAHDLVYTISHRPEGVQGVAAAFRAQTEGKHGATVRSALDILRRRFGHEPDSAGYTKDGPIAVARFELGNDADGRDRRVLRQREASDLIDRLLKGVGSETRT